MDALKSLFEASPISALFLSLAVGYTIGKIRIGRFQLGGLAGTLFAAIIIGQVGVEVDQNIKTMSFAVFIYTLGFVSGPQFFQSLGRSTLDQLHLTVFCSAVIFTVVWGLAHLLDLDQGTAAGLLAGATTESASVGTAGDAIEVMNLDPDVKKTLQSNIAVTYAITYLFGFMLVVFYVTTLAPRLMGVNLKEAAKAYELEMGNTEDRLEPGQVDVLQSVLVRVYDVSRADAVGTTLGQLRQDHTERVHVQQVIRDGERCELSPDLPLALGDLVTLTGKRDAIVIAGEMLGEEVTDLQDMEFVSETRDVVITARQFVGITLTEMGTMIDPNLRRGVFAIRLERAEREIALRPGVVFQGGDVLTLHGSAEAVEATSELIGYTQDPHQGVDYVYLGLGIVVGILIGMVTVPVAGSEVGLHTGGGCLISGLVFGWLRSKRPTFGSMPAATALHLRDYGLAIFIASVGLASGPQALILLQEKGVILPLLSMVVVLVPLISCTYYARLVLKMNPVVVCGALAGMLTCTPALNALVAEADSEAPVFGYTVPYAVANVILTLLGPVIVMTT
jgi:putative transport protein